MIGWIILVLSSYFIYAGSNVIDKVLRTSYVKNSFTLVILNSFINLIIAAVMILLNPSVLTTTNTGIMVAAGVVSTFGAVLYYIALSRGEVSRVVPLFNFIPIFALIMAFAFLGEGLTYVQLFSFVFIVAGGFILTVTKDIKGMLKLDASFWLVILSSLLYAAAFVMLKYGLEGASYYTVQTYVELGVVLAGLIVIPFSIIFKTVKPEDFNYTPKAILLAGANETIYVIGRLIGNIAISLVPVALVVAFGGFQGLFVLLISVVLSIHFPRLFKEEITRKAIITKLVALSLMFVGVALLAFS